MSPNAQLFELVWLGMTTGLLGTSQSLLSSTYMIQASWSCFRLFKQTIAWALAFARLKAGRRSATRIPMMAMKTKSSIKVKARASPPLTPPRRGACVRFEFIENRTAKIAHTAPDGSGHPRLRREIGRDGVRPSLPIDRLEACPTFSNPDIWDRESTPCSGH